MNVHTNICLKLWLKAFKRVADTWPENVSGSPKQLVYLALHKLNLIWEMSHYCLLVASQTVTDKL